MLVGNKIDLVDGRKISYEQGKDFADILNLEYIETSARNSQNINQTFIYLTKDIISKFPKTEPNPRSKPNIRDQRKRK